MVSLAKRLEGKPFHLLATHCQRGTKADVVDYVKSKGLSVDTPNMTVSSFGGHAKVKGNGYVPYYMVFDHHGDLVHHHMCGDYHGGDGLKMIELVDKLLADVPAIYLGKAPFVAVAKLAKQVGKVERLPAAIKAIDKMLAEQPSPDQAGELKRLAAAIEDYRKRMLNKVEQLHASAPSQILPHLKKLQKQFVGTAGGVEIGAQLKALSQSKQLASSVRIDKSYRKAMAKLGKKKQTPRLKRSTAKRLEKLIAGHEALPISKKVRAAITDLGQ